MRKLDLILPGVFAVFGAVILWQSLTQMDYFYADRGAPGPGFLSFWVSAGVLLCSLSVLFSEMRLPREKWPNREWPDAIGRRRILEMVAGFVGLLIGIQIVGFVLASILFMIAVSYILGLRKLLLSVPVSVAMGLFIDLVFETGLRLSLPGGLLGDYVGDYLPWIF